MRQKYLSHKFVKFIPERLEEGVLYISRQYHTAVHQCCCGCGKEVVTPLNPTDWALKMDGDAVTLHPSIGNWGFPCRSHYFIRRNKVVWTGQMSQRQIERGRKINQAQKSAYFESINCTENTPAPPLPSETISPKGRNHNFVLAVWYRIKKLF